MKLACYAEEGSGDGRGRLGVYTDAGIIAVAGDLAREYPSIRAVIERDGFAKIADIGFWVGEQRDDELLYELRL